MAFLCLVGFSPYLSPYFGRWLPACLFWNFPPNGPFAVQCGTLRWVLAHRNGGGLSLAVQQTGGSTSRLGDSNIDRRLTRYSCWLYPNEG